jgi:ribosome-associated translation inhibitor RaiA
MRLDIHHQGVALSDAARAAVARHLGAALARFAPRLLRAAVYVSEQNGPRGGVDKRCRVLLRLRRHGELTVAVDDADLYAAVHRAAGRAAQALGRELDRRRAARHQAAGR